MPTDDELYEGFPKVRVEAWKAEAEARWSETYRESNRRVRAWSKENRAAVKAVGERIPGSLARFLRDAMGVYAAGWAGTAPWSAADPGPS
jgi:hypothetical protein